MVLLVALPPENRRNNENTNAACKQKNAKTSYQYSASKHELDGDGKTFQSFNLYIKSVTATVSSVYQEDKPDPIWY